MTTTNTQVFIGTDCGATMSKIGGGWADGTTVSTKLHQRATNSHLGPHAVVSSWIAAISEYLTENQLDWDHVNSVGLAIHGPYLRYGVLGHSANLPAVFDGWDFHTAYSQALAQKAGRAIPLIAGNDGAFGGVGEAQRVRGATRGSVLMLAPGSGLGSVFFVVVGLLLLGVSLVGLVSVFL